MKRSAIWIIFLLLVFGFTVWFVVVAGFQLIDYYKLTTQVEVKVEKWDVAEISSNKYAVQAIYSYEFGEKDYRGNGQIGSSYPNPWAAKRAVEKWTKERWFVWVNPKAPEKAVIDRKFPYKATVSAAILLGLVIYFICLGIYVGVKYERRRNTK